MIHMCANCKKRFDFDPYTFESGVRFCSPRCRSSLRNKIYRMFKESLEDSK